ncbi:MAG: RloB family protein [Alphaproteobacteria bacterium]
MVKERSFNRNKPLKTIKQLLIVCADSTKSVTYLNQLKREYRGKGFNLNVEGKGKSNAVSVFKYAQKLIKKSGVAYDTVFCEFDKDNDPHFESVRQQIKNESNFIDCSSNPCFEFWLVLHYEKTSHSIHTQECYKRLEKHIPTYNKKTSCYKELFDITKDKQPIAIKNARNLETESHENFSLIYRIFEEIERLASENHKPVSL